MSNPVLYEISYSADSCGRFAAWAQQPWAIFLDSGRPKCSRGRYDFLAAEPRVTLTTFGDLTEIAIGGTKIQSRDNPFTLVRTYLGQVTTALPEIPFCTGVMGYFAYDLARCLERLPTLAVDDMHMPEMAVGIYDWVVVVDHHLQRCWLVCRDQYQPGAEKVKSLISQLENIQQIIPDHPFQVTSKVTANFDQQSYSQAFQRIKQYIFEGDCYQVNLAQRFSARVVGDAWDAYRQLRYLNPAPFSAFFRIPQGVVLCSSPERFLKVSDNEVETKPIKGTRPRSGVEGRDDLLAEELRTSKKDRAENLMIVDLLRNDLGKTCAIGTVKVPRLFEIETFATVHHLVSTVTGRLANGKTALDLLRDCFPGGSITGAPKLRAMEIIEECEPHRRNIYCGSIGYIGIDGAMDTNIAIRTMIIREGWMHCWAGGGIVTDSRMESEYQECLHKAAAMLSLLSSMGVAPMAYVGS